MAKKVTSPKSSSAGIPVKPKMVAKPKWAARKQDAKLSHQNAQPSMYDFLTKHAIGPNIYSFLFKK